ncbi:hypothetical protein [Streptomyces bluensis]|uniref:hypothetical protein n=1 Tax=Streptomyces bluensis TaxID=33897 RepID=UPI003322DD52
MSKHVSHAVFTAFSAVALGNSPQGGTASRARCAPARQSPAAAARLARSGWQQGAANPAAADDSGWQ